MYFVLYRDSASQWRWTLYAANHLKIADSAEGYTSKQHAQHGIDLVKSTNAYTQVIER
jgi:uncharacterized protein YegP (UPF0339 family)